MSYIGFIDYNTLFSVNKALESSQSNKILKTVDKPAKKINTSVFSKPNRRQSSQRRANQTERRQNVIPTKQCRRSTTLKRRRQDRRLALHSLDWVQLTNTKNTKNQYTCANDTPRLGQFVDLAI